MNNLSSVVHNKRVKVSGREKERERESAFSERVYSDIVDLKREKIGSSAVVGAFSAVKLAV